jgi:hypothetical protein
VLTAFFVGIAKLGSGGITLPAEIFFAIVAVALIQDFRLALSVADRVAIGGDRITYRVAFGTRRASLSSIRKAQVLDHGRREDPRHVARFVLPRSEFWVSDRLRGFDRLVNQITLLAPKADVAPMSVWERFWWLQWFA